MRCVSKSLAPREYARASTPGNGDLLVCLGSSSLISGPNSAVGVQTFLAACFEGRFSTKKVSYTTPERPVQPASLGANCAPCHTPGSPWQQQQWRPTGCNLGTGTLLLLYLFSRPRLGVLWALRNSSPHPRNLDIRANAVPNSSSSSSTGLKEHSQQQPQIQHQLEVPSTATPSPSMAGQTAQPDRNTWNHSRRRSSNSGGG